MKSFSQFISEMSLRDLNHAEKEIDTVYMLGGADLEFTQHFRNRVLDVDGPGRREYDDNQSARDVDVTPEEFVKMFKKFWREKGLLMAKQLQKDPKSFEFVLKDVSSQLNIPVAVSFDKGRKVVRLDCKTIMRKSSFMTGNQRVIQVRT